VLETAQRPPVLELEQPELDEGLGERLLGPGFGRDAAFVGQAEELVEELGVDDELAGVGAALVGERRAGDPPAAVEWTDQLVVGHERSVEEDLVEVGLVGDLAEWPDVDPRRSHVDHERGDALVLRRLGIGAGEAQAPVGELGIGGPHLLAVEFPTAVDFDGPGGDSGEVRAGIGFGEELAEQLVGVEDAREPALLLRVGAVGQQGRADQVHADPTDQLRGSGAGQLLLNDVVVQRRRIAAAEGARPRDADEPGIGE